MPIYLPAPQREARGPDGRGWNRLTYGLDSLDDQCALKPRCYTTLYESQDTRRARWGGYGYCNRAGACSTCPVLASAQQPKRNLDATVDRVLVRIRDVSVGTPTALIPGYVRIPYVMDDPDAGWDSPAHEWTWEDLSNVPGWKLGSRHWDDSGEGFWLERCAVG